MKRRKSLCAIVIVIITISLANATAAILQQAEDGEEDKYYHNPSFPTFSRFHHREGTKSDNLVKIKQLVLFLDRFVATGKSLYGFRDAIYLQWFSLLCRSPVT